MKLNKYLISIFTAILLTITVGYAQGISNNERNDYLIALGLFEDGLYQSTELRLQDFLYKYSSSEWRESAYYLLGKSQFYLNKYPEVRNILKEFKVQFPFSTLIDDAEFLIGESIMKKVTSKSPQNNSLKLLMIFQEVNC